MVYIFFFIFKKNNILILNGGFIFLYKTVKSMEQINILDQTDRNKIRNEMNEISDKIDYINARRDFAELSDADHKTRDELNMRYDYLSDVLDNDMDYRVNQEYYDF